ncbi:MAG: cyclase family protein [Methanoregula sp.]|jgi:arylformamidase|uniref:cyclase family protein n=1 Tax=Methanoregula sp. TaxID=2052170 RepID=UPI003D0D0E38
MEIIDLAYEIEEKMSIFDAPWHAPVTITQMGRIDCEGRETRRVCLGTHAGTHMDAPLHFIPGGDPVGRIPLEKLIGPVTIVDLTHLGKNGVVTREMLADITVTERMIFYFGWGRHWKTPQFFHDYPWISPGAADYLISNKIVFLGMDTPSPDDSRINIRDPGLDRACDSPVHKLLLGNRIVLVEYLAHLDRVKGSGWNLAAFPLNIRGADGSPVRVCLFRGGPR